MNDEIEEYGEDPSSEEYKLHKFETPTGDVVKCTEKEAFDAGYIAICPECLFNIVTWWQLEDHGKCIECWHKSNKV